jgi:hypothetical protein
MFPIEAVPDRELRPCGQNHKAENQVKKVLKGSSLDKVSHSLTPETVRQQVTLLSLYAANERKSGRRSQVSQAPKCMDDCKLAYVRKLCLGKLDPKCTIQHCTHFQRHIMLTPSNLHTMMELVVTKSDVCLNIFRSQQWTGVRAGSRAASLTPVTSRYCGVASQGTLHQKLTTTRKHHKMASKSPHHVLQRTGHNQYSQSTCARSRWAKFRASTRGGIPPTKRFTKHEKIP